jgi:hypothetical protein
MRTRCYNKKYPFYKDYGGRGIKVCERWLGKNGFTNFLNDMGERPSGYSIDRIENDGNYSKSNCRWTTTHVQSRNKRSNMVFEINGVAKIKQDWAKELGISHQMISYFLRKGFPFKKIHDHYSLKKPKHTWFKTSSEANKEI